MRCAGWRTAGGSGCPARRPRGRPWPARSRRPVPGPRLPGPRLGRGACWPPRACRWYPVSWPPRPRTPMRSGGTELLAGVTVDPTFGPVLAVGLGGIWTEILKDTSLRVLPVDAAEVRRMLGELRGWPLLQGARGTQPANLDAVAEAIAGLGAAALSLNGTLRALEVNPLWVN